MTKLIVYEMKKIFAYRYLLLILFFLLVLAFFSDFKFYYSDSMDYVKTERDLYKQYGGILTEKKYNAIRGIANMEDTMDASGKVKREYMVADMAMRQISYMASLKKTNDSILERAKDNVAVFEVKNLPDFKHLNEKILKMYKNVSQPHLIPSGNWKDLFTFNKFLAFPLLFILLIVSNIFSKEHENNLYTIIKSSELGLGKTFLAKLIVSGICAIGTMLLFILINIMVKCHTSCLYGWNAPVRSIEELEYSWLSLSILQTVILFSGCMCFAALIFGIAAALISSFFHNNLFSMSVALAYSIFAYLWLYAYKYLPFMLNVPMDSGFIESLLQNLRIFVPTLLLEPFYYFDSYDYIMIFSYPISKVVVNIMVTIFLMALLIWISYRMYTFSSVKRRWRDVI